MHGADEGVWVERMLPDYDNLRVAFEHVIADRDIDIALRLVTSLSEYVHLRIGYESSGWAERVVELAEPDHPLYAAAVGFAARGAWNKGEFDRARSLAMLAEGRVPGRGNGRVAYPGDVLADLALYEGDADVALAHYDAEMARARADDDPIRLVWTLFYVAICHAALRDPEDGVAAAQEAVEVSDCDGQPDRAVDGALCAWPGVKEVRAGPGAGAVRRCCRAGRIGAELLVARHRVDGGRGHPCRSRRTRHDRRGISST